MEMIFNILEVLIVIATEQAFILYPYHTEHSLFLQAVRITILCLHYLYMFTAFPLGVY